ncbi:MAG: class I SAM-dependent methyltransferase [Caulobacteraceae bacterium]
MDRAAYDRMRVLQETHWWFRGRRRILAALIGDLRLPKPARILEAGCGPGGNLSMLGRFGSVTALEPDEASRAYAAEHFGVKVEGGLLPDGLPFEAESFDLVCAFDVIEHVEEDAASVAALARLIRPGGYFAATVPAQPWMWSRHDELHHHKRRYRMAPFRGLFEAAGLGIVKVSYFNAALFPLIAGVRALKMATGSTSADDDAMPPAPLNDALAVLFGAEALWLRRAAFPTGVSIVLIARKVA